MIRILLSAPIQAVRTLCKAVMLNPADRALWEDDLPWACSVRDRMKNTSASNSDSNTKSSSSSVAVETRGVDGDDELDDSERESSRERGVENSNREEISGSPARCKVLRVPDNYVHLRG